MPVNVTFMRRWYSLFTVLARFILLVVAPKWKSRPQPLPGTALVSVVLVAAQYIKPSIRVKSHKSVSDTHPIQASLMRR